MTVRVLLVDDQELVRFGFSMILSAADDLEVVGEANNGIAAITQVEALEPDVVLMDIRMPDMDGLAACAQVSDKTSVVMVTTFDDDEYVDRALENGAKGFLLKDSGPELLCAAVRAAADGDFLISPKLTAALLARSRNQANTHVAVEHVAAEKETETTAQAALLAVDQQAASKVAQLTSREKEIAQTVAKGRTNQQICSELFISLGTVKTHLTSIQNKLDASNRVEIAATVWAAGEVGR